MRRGLEAQSGFDVGDVEVHYDSPRPAAMSALALTDGNQIHLGPGQEQHLAHEAWHVVQQKQGRVKPSGFVAGVAVNDDSSLESEADRMGGLVERSQDNAAHPPLNNRPRLGQSGNAPLVQARLPHPGYWNGLKTETDNAEANLTGLQNLVRRTYLFDLSPEQQDALKLKCEAEYVNVNVGLYAKPPTEMTEHLYNWMCHEFPHLLYPGPMPSSGPQSDSEAKNHQALVERALETLGAMSAEHLVVPVFGAEFLVRAVARITNAHKWVTANAAKIVAERSGEGPEMMIGGGASYGGPITLPLGSLSAEPNAELVVTTVHESLHAANGDVLDKGGYAHQGATFREQSGPKKLVNASHYEEVARRVLGASPVGGDFVPTVRPKQGGQPDEEEDTRTPETRVTDRYVETVQIAWERAQNVHGFFRSLLDRTLTTAGDRASITPIVGWSRKLGLQTHDRYDQGGKTALTLNHVDLLQVETLTKSLARMMAVRADTLVADADLGPGIKVRFPEAYESILFDTILRKQVGKHADARWLTTERFGTVVQQLAAAPRDVRDVVD